MTDKEQIEKIEKVLQDEQIKIANTVEEFAKLQQVGINKCNAEALYNAGYHKTVWHKVADGDLPKDYQEIRWVDGTGGYYNGTYYKTGTEERFSSDLGCDFYKDEVIAWTGLPEYKE